MQEASLDHANLMGASLNSASLNGVSLFEAQLQGASLKYAQLDAAVLASAALDGASLSSAFLTGAILADASLRGADFSGAWMFGAAFYRALAQDASFEKAQIQGASLEQANFSGAKFEQTLVYGAEVSGALFKGALIKDVLSSRRWFKNYGNFSTYPTFYTKEGDPFGKESDRQGYSYDYSYYDTFTPEPVDIPVAETDRLADLFPNGLSQDSSGTEIKKRLARLAPDSKTADWTKLADKTISEDEYIKGLGERLIIIACSKAGEGHVAHGLIRSGRLCLYQKEVEAVLRSGVISPIDFDAEVPDGAFDLGVAEQKLHGP